MPIALGERAYHGRAHPHHETPPAIAEEWRRYRASGSLTARDRLINHYMASHVRPIAVNVRAHLPVQVELDDLIQQGYLGLIDAMDRFDADRDIRFETFSRRRVFGAIQDYLRSIDSVPRLTRVRSKQIQGLLEDFRKRHGRPADDDDLRRLLDEPEPVFQRYLADRDPAMMVPFSSLQGDSEGEHHPDADAMDGFPDRSEVEPALAAARRDLQRYLTRGLDGRDRLIIILYYYEEMTMREIGATLGISESRVSQRLETILACLRSRLVPERAEHEFIFA
ncbi:MAG: sigma-70 family RNA polymerase sigma factor [Planctomycetota bacterium]|nr:sigma-70 family RNA polymerase sigma factor [Planctomycetota bacterium]